MPTADRDPRRTGRAGADARPAVRVANRAIGRFRDVLQVGTVIGNVHLHQPRRFTVALAVAVWLPALVAVLTLVPSDSRAPVVARATSPAARPDLPTSGATPTTTVAPTVAPVETSTVVVPVPGDPVTAFDGVRIAVGTVGFTSTDNGAVSCGGGGNGPGGGSCTSLGGSGPGSSVVAVLDFSVRTPAVTCTVSSVHLNDSAVVTEPGGRWIRLVLIGVGPIDQDPDTPLPVTFEVSLGHGGTVPLSPKVCVPG